MKGAIRLYEKDKAVSPIIATILIVAITVVLAATLYAVVGGYGSLIGKGTPTAGITVTSTTTSGGAPVYTVSVTSVSGTVSLSNVQVKIILKNGNSYTSNALSSYSKSTSITGSGYSLLVSTSSGNDNLGAAVSMTLTGQKSTTPTIAHLYLIDTATGGTMASWNNQYA